MKAVQIPGKVMLSGEYAVLYGGLAVMLPVDRRLSVEQVEHRPSDLYPPAVNAALEIPIPPLEYSEKKFLRPEVKINRREFLHDSGSGSSAKLGLGSSAAEAVGVVALRFECAGLNWREHRDEVLHYALEAHSIAQNGIGSGADVAACAFEKPIYYRLIDGQPYVEPVKSHSKMHTPLALVWTGQSADTRLLVERFEIWAASGGRQAKELIPRLVELSLKIAPEWFTPTVPKLFDLLGDYNAVLSRCTQDAGIPYQLPVHRELKAWASAHGGRAKPLGAGGGDMMLLVGDLPHAELNQLVIPLEFSRLN